MPSAIQTMLHGYSAAVPTNGQVLDTMIAVAPATIRMVVAACGASGAGATVLDVLRNGTSVWTAAANRPTLASGKTGRFTVMPINRSAVQIGDVLQLVVATAGGGSQLSASVALEDPQGAS